MMLRAEVFVLFQNGVDGLHKKGNVRALSRFLHTKYNGKYGRISSRAIDVYVFC